MEQTVREKIQTLALKSTENKHRCGLAVSMGVGKTLIGLKHMESEFNNGATKFLVVAPKLSIFKSWQDDAEKFNLQHLLKHITFTTYLSLQKQGIDFDCIYLDECHNLLDTHDLSLAFYNNKILGLTGTPPRYANSEKGVMVQRYCPIVYSYITDDAVDDQILNDYKITVHLLPLSKAKTHKVCKKAGGFFLTSEFDNYNYWTKRIETTYSISSKQMVRIMRMQALMQYGTKEKYAKQLLQTLDEKCIVFCNNTEQADRVCDNSYHSKNPNSEENLDNFKKGVFHCLSAVQQLNEGVNIPNLKYGIILHAYSNERKTNQRIGRLLRLNPDEKAEIHILAYNDSIDSEWVVKSLQDLDPKKITYQNAKLNS